MNLKEGPQVIYRHDFGLNGLIVTGIISNESLSAKPSEELIISCVKKACDKIIAHTNGDEILKESGEQTKLRMLLSAFDSALQIAEGMGNEIELAVVSANDALSPLINRRLMQLEERGLQKGIEI